MEGKRRMSHQAGRSRHSVQVGFFLPELGFAASRNIRVFLLAPLKWGSLTYDKLTCPGDKCILMSDT